MAWDANKLAQQYEPQPGDCEPEKFRGRVQSCTHCPHRLGHTCEALQILCSVHARGQFANCPLRKWPGESPPRQTPINVVLVSPGLFPGGAERWMISLAKWMPRFGPISVTAALITNPRQIEEGMSRNLQCFCPVFPWHLDTPQPAAVEALAQADIVLVWGVSELGWIRSHNPTAKIVWCAHGTCQRTVDLARVVAPHVDHWAGVSELARRTLPAEAQPRMKVIHNGAEIERCTPAVGRVATRRQWGLQPHQVAVTYIGRLSNEKRPWAVAEAVAALPEEFVAVIVGSGWQEAETRERAHRIAPGRVLFPGFMEQVGDALAASDVWFNASPSEAWCLSLGEAALAGIPIASTATGCIPELENLHGVKLVEHIPDGANGQQMATAVLRALSLNHRERREAFRKLAFERFTAAVMGKNWAAWFVDLMQPPPVAPAPQPSWWQRLLPTGLFRAI